MQSSEACSFEGSAFGIRAESGTLAALETSAEASDSAPTPALRLSAIGTIATPNADWAHWQETKSVSPAMLNRELSESGVQPIAIPAQAQLKVDEPAGGVRPP